MVPNTQVRCMNCECRCCQHGCSPQPLNTDKVSVLQRSARGDTALGVVDHELVDKVDAIDADLGLRVADVLPGLARPLREGRLELRQVHQTGPLLDSRGAELLEYLEDGVDLRVACEERRPCGHLRDDATHAPDVDGHAVACATQQDLWGSVPHGHHLVRVLGHGHGVGPSQAEVGDLQAQPGVDEEVLGLEVSMQDSVGVAEIDAVTQLVGEELDSLGIQWAAQRLHVLLEVVLAKLEDEHKLLRGAEDIQQPDDVRVGELPHEGDLADGRARHALIAGFLALLHGDKLASADLPRLVDLAIGALPEDLRGPPCRGLLEDIILVLELTLQLLERLVPELGHRARSRGRCRRLGWKVWASMA
mmetsp:Transcript_28794/g.74912  ORF Transcript_28794/g.74912 Transcript_28794/m.74912 type:complete len:362 (+) Transcript_28794:179-1264(+)